jgi:protein-S-isoprenylcysteine O-methyltransferase Ste14
VTDSADRPGVVAMPPLIYFGAVMAGLVLDLLIPIALPVPPALRWAGAGLLVAGFVIAGIARATFIRAGTNVNPAQPATALVQSGPYQISRNPMYVALNLMLVGLALWTRVGWFLILWPAVLAVMHWGVVLREERYLARKCDAEYEAYRGKVRRYL